MKKQNIIVFGVVIIAVVAVVVLDQLGILPVRQYVNQLAGNQGGNTTADPGTSQSGSTATDIQAGHLEMDDIQTLLAKVDVNQRQALLEDETAFREFVKQEAINLSLLAGAKSNKLETDPDTLFLMQRNADNVLREVYVNKLINIRLPVDFPTEEQIKEYYDTNKATLVLEERVAVWQIFLPVTGDMSAGSIVEQEKEANRIAAEIKQNKMDFTKAAITYSKNQPSNVNGGYMGILKVSELIPGIDKPLLALKEGEISPVVRSEMGFHILKRGPMIPAQEMTLDQIKGEIRNLILNQARARTRNVIIEQVVQTFPVTLDETRIEEWRQTIKTGTGQSDVAN